MNHLVNKPTPLTASLVFTALASTGTSVIWSGLPFIAKVDYGFGEVETLALYVTIGLVYVLGALSSGWVTNKLQPHISSRSILACLLVVQAAACSLPLFCDGGWVIWVAGGVAGMCSSWIWPIVESHLVAGRHGRAMRRAIGWWNMVWMVAVAAVMFAMAPLMKEHAPMALVGLGGMNILAIGVLPWFRKTPAQHDEASVIEPVPDEYQALLKGSRILLPLSYIICGVLSPLLPFVFSSLEVGVFWQTPLVAVWMMSRVFVTGAMWHWATWHGRWSVQWVAAISMALGFVGILIAQDILLLIIGLVIFGVGMGMTYYAALYYAMSVGRAKVGAGGTHEALIGGGYMVGPMIGLATLQSASSGQSASMNPLILVVLALLIVAIGALAIIWRKAR